MALAGGSHIAAVHGDGEERSAARFVGFHKRKDEVKLPDLLLDRLGLRKKKKNRMEERKSFGINVAFHLQSAGATFFQRNF